MSSLGALLSVVMVGHSLFGATGPTMLAQALEAGGHNAQVQAQIINGAPLKYNWEHAATAQGINAREVLAQGNATHLILTEAIPLDNHVTWSNSHGFAEAFADEALLGNPDVRIYVQETWHSLKSGTGASVDHDAGAETPWRVRLQEDLPVWQGIVDHLSAVLTAKDGQVSLIPAGQAMGHLYDEIAAGDVPGITGIDAFFNDDIHLSDLGHYFVAMVQYASVMGRSPVGLPTQFKDRYGGRFTAPSADLAETLQGIAWQTVTEFEDLTGRPRSISNSLAEHPAIKPRPMPPMQVENLDPQPSAKPATKALAIGLASVADWSPQVPFLDHMKAARPWFGHRLGQWGGMDHAELAALEALDADGWPQEIPRGLGSIGTVILTDMPRDALSLAGRYVLRYEGSGVVEVSGRAERVRYGTGEVRFDYTPGPGSVEIRIQRINRSDPLRGITVVQEDHLAAFDAGAQFHPTWLTRLSRFSALRFMDWMETNNSQVSRWGMRPTVGQASYADGVPIEVMIDLANELRADPWFNVPHLADDTFVLAFAQMVRDRLDPELTAYIEFSNEVWNWQFAQARWADAEARARWGQSDKWMQYYGLRAAEVARIWSEVFAETPERLVNVLSSQTAWLGLEQEVLTAPLVVAEGLAPPAAAFDAYAISGYFGGVLGLEDYAALVASWLRESRAVAEHLAREKNLTASKAQAFVRRHRYDHASAVAGRALAGGADSELRQDTVADLVERVWPYHARVAAAAGLDLIMYEGGSHVVGIGPRVDDPQLTSFLQHFNYTPEMGALYRQLLAGWQAVGGQLFNAYSDVYAPTKWGSWGALRHLDDQNPRWEALMAFQ
ncbi:MAG: hypothetical protein AAF943_04355 [Pseudomonadota bacterium]